MHNRPSAFVCVVVVVVVVVGGGGGGFWNSLHGSVPLHCHYLMFRLFHFFHSVDAELRGTASEFLKNIVAFL